MSIREVVEAHSERYDRDCDEHNGCTCGWKPPVPTDTREALPEGWLAYTEHLIEALEADRAVYGTVRFCNNHDTRGPHDCALEWGGQVSESGQSPSDSVMVRLANGQAIITGPDLIEWAPGYWAPRDLDPGIVKLLIRINEAGE